MTKNVKIIISSVVTLGVIVLYYSKKVKKQQNQKEELKQSKKDLRTHNYTKLRNQCLLKRKKIH